MASEFVRGALAPALLIAIAACSGPMGLLPGGPLEGEENPAPESFAFAGDAGTMQLETLPAEPYSVNLAYTVIDGRLFINAGNTETQWVKNMAVDPMVRMRLDGKLYALRSERVTDAAQVDRFGEAWTSQSFFRRDPREYDEVWIYELVAR